jgi:predicted phosphodiesterase
MYYFNPEKPLRLAKFYGIGGIFNLAIQILFTRVSKLMKNTRLFEWSKKIGLLADSHGNLESIKKGIIRLNEFNAQTLIHLGDIFDSLENDNLYEIFKIIIQNNFLSVKGNNDFQVENLLNNGHTFDISPIEKNKIISFLKKMPMLLTDESICFAHSLPFNSIRSFYEPVDTGTIDRAKQLFNETAYQVIFCGHSHSSILFRLRAGHVTRELIHPNKMFYFNACERYIVIVGSSDNGECGIFDKDQMSYQRTYIY